MSVKQQIEKKKNDCRWSTERDNKGETTIFHYDNSRSHTSLATCQKMREFTFEVLINPTYSPDLIPSNLTSQHKDRIDKTICCVFLTRCPNFYSNRIFIIYKKSICCQTKLSFVASCVCPLDSSGFHSTVLTARSYWEV